MDQTTFQNLVNQIDTTGNNGTTGQELKNIFEYLLPLITGAKFWVGAISQSGTSAPNVDWVGLDTIGDVSFNYIGVGDYSVNGTFPFTKSFIFTTNGGGLPTLVGIGTFTANEFRIGVTQNGIQFDNLLYRCPIFIVTFP